MQISINLKGIKSVVLRFFFRATRFLSVMKTLILMIPATITCSDWRKYILLLQLDTDINEKDRYTGKLMWGDSGVANFFITPEDLAKRDFSRVAFVFDCC